MNTQIAIPHDQIIVPVPSGHKPGFTKSIFPWHRKCDLPQAKGNAGSHIVKACIEATGVEQVAIINGAGDLAWNDQQSEVKLAIETVMKLKTRDNYKWRFNGVRPEQKGWDWLHVVIQLGDHADNVLHVLEYTREAVMQMIADSGITRYGQFAKEDDNKKENVIEVTAMQNSSRNDMRDILIPRANNVLTISQSLLQINWY